LNENGSGLSRTKSHAKRNSAPFQVGLAARPFHFAFESIERRGPQISQIGTDLEDVDARSESGDDAGNADDPNPNPDLLKSVIICEICGHSAHFILHKGEDAKVVSSSRVVVANKIVICNAVGLGSDAVDGLRCQYGE
jgi:hypothetical protein